MPVSVGWDYVSVCEEGVTSVSVEEKLLMFLGEEAPMCLWEEKGITFVFWGKLLCNVRKNELTRVNGKELLMCLRGRKYSPVCGKKKCRGVFGKSSQRRSWEEY